MLSLATKTLSISGFKCIRRDNVSLPVFAWMDKIICIFPGCDGWDHLVVSNAKTEQNCQSSDELHFYFCLALPFSVETPAENTSEPL